MIGFFDVPKKATVIRLRWPVVIICSYLLLHSRGEWFSPIIVHGFLVLYLSSNAALYFIDENLFDSSYFYIPLVIFDTLSLTGSLIVSGQIGTEFYLTYFLIIILCAIWQDFRGSIVVAVLVTILYGYLLFKTTEIYDPSIYLRFPFLFVVSIFYGYFAHVVRVEKALNEQSEAMRFKSVASLAAGVAHEVKNPLAILLQGVDYLSKKVETNDKNVSLVFKDMRDAVKRADSIVRGLLDFSSLRKLNMIPENLNSIIENSLLLVKNHLDRFHIEVIKDLKKDIPRTNVDRSRVEQVFINLFLNAVEAMPNGGQLWVRTYIEDLKKEKELVIAEVENVGPSIPKDILRDIFNPFVTTKRGIGGTGLGLSVVKNIIDTHDGKIQISNRDRGGVKVSVAFKT